MITWSWPGADQLRQQRIAPFRKPPRLWDGICATMGPLQAGISTGTENGLPAFRATLAAFQHVTEALRQPRHDYLLRTRQARRSPSSTATSTPGNRLSAEAADLGHAIDEGDTGNVRMSQRVEIARARDDPAELRVTAADAVR